MIHAVLKHLSGEAKGLCPITLFGLFVGGTQHKPASSSDAEAAGHGRQSCDRPLALQLPDRQATMRRDQVVFCDGDVRYGPHQHWSPSRMCAFP